MLRYWPERCDIGRKAAILSYRDFVSAFALVSLYSPRYHGNREEGHLPKAVSRESIGTAKRVRLRNRPYSSSRWGRIRPYLLASLNGVSGMSLPVMIERRIRERALYCRSAISSQGRCKAPHRCSVIDFRLSIGQAGSHYRE